MNEELKRRHLNNLRNALVPLETFLTDEDVTDILINPDGNLFVEKFCCPIEKIDLHIPTGNVKNIINYTASLLEQTINYENPILSGVIPEYDARIEAIIPPYTKAPTISIRKRPSKVVDLFDYVKNDWMSNTHYTAILDSIDSRDNIVLAGGTGTGKTTMMNAILAQIAERCPDHRLFIIEDTPEVVCSSNNYVNFCAPPEKSVEGVRTALRKRPERIIFSELRFGETALELLKAWNTGHPGGLTTIHANSAEQVIPRLKALVQECIKGEVQELFIADTIGLIIYLEKSGKGPVLHSIVKPHADWKTGQYNYSN